MTVYVDLILIQNIIMNYIIILTTGIICKIDIKQYRMICASANGAIYAVIGDAVTACPLSNKHCLTYSANDFISFNIIYFFVIHLTS